MSEPDSHLGSNVAGVDEAGRGPLAGPVVAAAVILPRAWVLEGIPDAFADLNDSKQLTEAQRDRFFAGLTGDPAVRFAIAAVEPSVIDEINILQATHRAMNQALADLGTTWITRWWTGAQSAAFAGPRQPW